jgi:transcription elongation GreA/GreB family factor
VNKSELRQKILLQLESVLATQTAAAHVARDEAISEESKPENKYDTHGQEAAYLAEGQARLARDVQESIAFYQAFVPPAFRPDEPVAIGAIVKLQAAGSSIWYFIGPRAGGLEIPLDGQTVLVVSPQSPVGRQLLGRRQGETISAANRGQSQIISVQ